ncbi:MAG: response regulator [Eubacterium sp.]
MKKITNLPELIHDAIRSMQKEFSVKRSTLHVSVIELFHDNIIIDREPVLEAVKLALENAIKYVGYFREVKLVIEENIIYDNLSEFSFYISGIDRTNVQKIGIQAAKAGGEIVITNIFGDRLPCIQISIEAETKEDIKSESMECLCGKNVLIVDDDYLLAEWTRKLLLKEGMKCRSSFTSGKEAVQYVQQKATEGMEFGLVILGWQMPKMDGIETAMQLRRIIGNDIPIIMQTAYDATDVLTHENASFIDGIVMEPIFRTDLINILMDLDI